MSKTVDERVVEMRFDNRQFEQGVATTMSTLDKFKQKLNFSGASKGLDEIGAATSKVDMSGLGAGVESVSAKFSALQVIGITALANITNSAVDAGKKLVSSLSIDQVTAGWSKYEQKTASVQTIMNATGKSIEEVNGYLEKLMWFSDETSYGFTDMTSALATMTSSGGDIEKLIPLITGVANATAFAGKGANEFSRVMQYAVNQAYSLGYMQVQDWKTIEGATVNSKQLIQSLIKAGEELGKIKKGTVTIENFRNTLADKWVDTEVMEAGFGAFSEFSDAVYDLVSSGAVETANEGISELSGKYDELGEKAFKSAQEAKSFTEAIEATKDAVSSGWLNTFELVFGNYDEAKVLWTDMANSLWEIFAGGSESRNSILGDAMNSKWDTLVKKIEETGVSAEDFQEKLKETAKEHNIAIDDLIDEYGSLAKVISAGKLSKSVIVETIKKFADNVKTVGEATSVTTEKLEHFQGIVNKVIRGDFGNGAERMEKLAAAGEKYALVQGLVNKIWERNGKNWSDTTLKAEDLTAVINELSESELESLGYTEEQAKALKELADEAEKTGTPLNELIESLDKPSGRELVFSSIHNALEGLTKVIGTFRTAWSEIFTSDRMSAGIYRFVEGLNSFTEKMIMSEDTADNLRRTIKGLVALIDIAQTVFGGGLRLAFKLLSKVLEAFDMGILDLTARIGDAIVGFNEWLDSVIDFEAVFEVIAPYVVEFTDAIKRLFKSFKESKFVNTMTTALKKFWNILKKIAKLDPSMLSFSVIAKNIRESIVSLPEEMKEVGHNIIEGLQNGLGDKLSDIIAKAKEIGTKILETVKDVLGIQSPSTEMFEIGENIIVGLVNGIASGIQTVINSVAKIGTVIIDFFKDLDFSPIVESVKTGFADVSKKLGKFDWKKLLAIIPIGVVLVVVKEIYDFATAISEGIGNVNKVIDGLAGVEKSISKVIDAKAFETAAEGLEKIAKAIAILAAAVVVLSLVDPQNLYRSVAVIVVLSVILTMLSKAVSKLQAASAKIGKDGLKIAGLKTGLLTIGLALLAIAGVVKMMSGLSDEELKNGFIGLAGVIGALVVMYGALQALSLIPAKNVELIGPMLLKVAVVVGLMAVVCKLISGLSPEQMKAGAAFASGFLVFIALLNTIALIPSVNVDKLGGMLLKVSVALGIMVGVVKLASLLDVTTLQAAHPFIVSFLLFITALKLIALIPGDSMSKLGTSLMGISVAMLIMIGVVKLAGQLNDPDELKAATRFVFAFLVFIAALKLIDAVLPGGSMTKLAGTLLAMSAAIAILAGVVVLLSLLDPTALANATTSVVLLGLAMAAMIAAANGAQKCVGNLIAMALAVGIMAGAVAVLSTIDPEKLVGPTLAMTILMGMFALIVKMGSQMAPATGALIAMSLAVGILGGVLYLLAGLPAESTLAACVALSLAMLAFAGMMRIIGGAKDISGGALVSILVMTAVVAALGGVLYMLQNVDPGQAIGIVVSIGVFVGVLILALAAMQLIQAPAVIGIAALVVVTLLVAVLAGVLYALQGVDPTQAIQMVGVITAFLVAMEVVCLAAALVGAVAGPAIVGLGILVVFIGALGLVILGLAALAMDVIAGMPKMGSDLSAFMTNLQPFLDGIQSIPDNIVDKVTDLSKAIGKLGTRELLESIKGIFTTDGNSLADIGNELKTFGDGMVAFAASMVNVDTAIDALSKIKDLKEAIPDVDFSPLEKIGTSLHSYANDVAALNVAAIDTSIMLVRRLIGLATELSTADFNGVSNFNVLPIGMKLASYSLAASMVSVGAVSNSIIAAGQIRDFITSLTGLDTSGVAGFQSAVDRLAQTSIDKIVSGFKGGDAQLHRAGSDLINSIAKGMTSSQSKLASIVKNIVGVIYKAFVARTGEFNRAGKTLALALSQGLSGQRTQVKDTAKSLVVSAAVSLNTVYDDFYNSGAYLAKGFANGITANTFMAKAAATAMAQAALNAAREILKVESPSKEAATVGDYFGQGFVNAIVDYSKTAYDSSAEMANSAKKGLSDAIDKIRSVLESDVDTQPVIRPVVDFSDVESGVTRLNTMFGDNPLVGVKANVAAIGSVVDQRRQNGTNSDVVSAIDKLNKKFDTINRPSYNVGDITYSDDSEVAEAIQALIRVAKIERRV